MLKLVTLLLLISITVATDFRVCIEQVRDGSWGPDGGTDNRGRPVTNISNATAITYGLCLRACGASPERFLWSIFSQQFSAWLLPWLALVSQLPFGANDKLDNLVSALLTVGSPTLAAYSLALTVLNGRWIARRFAGYNYPNTRHAVKILSSLQQSPLTVTTTGSLLSSLIVLPENDEWWSELVIWLDYTHSWSISAATSTAWVVMAYVFTLIDSFTGDPTVSINSTGQGVGSLWLWLLPIIIGWLQLSPKCDSTRLRQAIERANKIAYIATPSGEPVLASSASMQHAISLSLSSHDPVRSDEQCTAPIFNYSRFLSWTHAVEEVREMFSAASDRAHQHRPVDPYLDWDTTEKKSFGPSERNRKGTLDQVNAYCNTVGAANAIRGNHAALDIWSRFFIASMIALCLQWGTTCAAIVIVWFTPTTGLGCRSGAYLLYGVLSTITWMILMISSFLSYYATTARPNTASTCIVGQLSIFLRRLGKVIASFNAVWIVVTCLFQFSNFYNRCYCNSSVFQWGSQAFDVIILNPSDLSVMRGAWIGAAFLAAGSAAVCVVFVNLLINPQLPE